MEGKLKQLITEAAESGQLDTVDWDHLPLPQELIKQEKLSGRPFTLGNGVMNAAPAVSSAPTPAPAPQPQPPRVTANKRVSRETFSEVAKVSSIPPWRRTNDSSNAFEDRVTLSSDKRRRLDGNDNTQNNSKFKTLELRRKRFEDTPSPYISSSTSSARDNQVAGSKGPIVGRCQTLEKNYFRLTSAPNPDVVRPLPVLEKTLELLKKKWRTENNYTYVCDQLKSLRQDLTVQHIRTEFTTTVYEIHARIALEKGDLGEYNQCQTQLRALYKRGLGGHPMEFLAYRILYFIYTRNWTAINDTLADLSDDVKKNPAVRHALEVRSALARGNYHRFFMLYLDTPNMGAYLMDMFVDRERLTALSCLCRGYKPDIPIRFITEELGFESDEQSARFILNHAPETLLQEREDGGVLLLTAKAGGIFEEARAKAHRLIDIKGQI
ncbi:hypothetical protein KEM54_003410 [Ascosphaera aggregata]|nr:hypothetical protein KEM54_003410 [Ascosphaera aggregata]